MSFIKGLPRSGGEKNYLEYIYRRPKFMATCIFAVYTLITASHFIVPTCILINVILIFSIHFSQGVSAANSVVFSECIRLDLFDLLMWIYSHPRPASFYDYRADMAQYATCCI
jgi:hypothetical protein